MTDDTPLPFDLPAVRRWKLTVDFNGGNQSSDAGLLLLREAERKLGVCRRLPAAMPDRRDADRIRHEMFEMVAARAMAIACGYKDAIDHDRLRHDPLMKIAVGRCPESGDPLASQSTITISNISCRMSFGLRRSRIAPETRRHTPSLRSASRSSNRPASEDWVPPLKSTVSFRRQTAGR